MRINTNISAIISNNALQKAAEFIYQVLSRDFLQAIKSTALLMIQQDVPYQKR